MTTKDRRTGQTTVRLSPQDVAAIRGRTRVGAELAAAGHAGPVEVLWTPEETKALREALAGKAVRIRRTTDRAS